MRLLVLLALLSCVPAMGQTVAGFTPGSFRVTEGGAAEYRIPIRVPPGIAGIEPKLALVYNSQAGNGHLGMGWSLEGLSSITRCPRTWAQDGLPGGVNYDWNDRFCLDGQRLVAIEVGSESTEYRTERESFSRVISSGIAGNGPAWFKVWTKSGQIMEYGNTTDSRIEAQGKDTVRVWALNKVSDIKGNYLTVSYVEDSANGDYYPHRIDYTGNATAGMNPGASLRFVHVGGRPDVVSQYRGGSLIRRAQRLANVQAFLGESLVHDYQLSYLPSSTTQRSRLTSVRHCDGTHCLPPTSFSWTDAPTGFGPGVQTWIGNGAFGESTGWNNSNPLRRFMTDVNGDGLPDIVGIYSSHVFVALNNGSSFGGPQVWLGGGAFGSDTGWTDENRYPRFLTDVNGDGLPDLVGFYANAVYVALNRGTHFGPDIQTWIGGGAFGADTGWVDENRYPRFLVDVNGDGRPDIVGIYADQVFVALNDGTKFGPAVQSWIGGGAFGFNTGWDNSNPLRRFVTDVNGDGLPDLVGIYTGQVYVALNRGTHFGPEIQTWVSDGALCASTGWVDDNRYPRFLVDLNGDGLPDLIGLYANAAYAVLNDGTKFGPQVHTWIGSGAFGENTGWNNSNPLQRYLIDLNGDGLPDVLGIYSNAVFAAMNDGTKFDPNVQTWIGDGAFGANTGWVDEKRYPHFLADLNGDGLPDLSGIYSTATFAAMNAGGRLPDLLASASNGFDAVTVSYLPLTTGIYTKDSGAVFPVVDVRQPLYAVSSAQFSNGAGGTLTTTYRYGGLKADVATGRGSLGFRWLESTDATGLKVRTEFRQEWPYVGLPMSVTKTHSASGVVLSLAVSNYSCTNPVTGTLCPIGPGKVYFPFASQSVESRRDLNGATLPTVTTTTQYDTFGNPTTITVGASDGHSKTTANTFTNDTVNWLIGRLTSSTVQSTSP